MNDLDYESIGVDVEKLSKALSEWASLMSVHIEDLYRSMASAILSSGLLEISSRISRAFPPNNRVRAVLRSERRRRRADFISRGKHGQKRPKGKRNT